MARVTGVGRNAPCPCGSGKKYKKCHLPIEASLRRRSIPQSVLNWVGRVEQERNELQDAGIFVNYVKPVIHKGKKFWALGARIYHTDNLNQTFHEFITEVLIDTFGRDWWKEQMELPDEDRHFVPMCFLKLREWLEANKTTSEEVRPGVFSMEIGGLGQYFVSLAFDLATLKHVLNLPQDLITRLRHKDQYQGARYELGLGALFARIDCEVTFLDDKSAKHPEFVARFRPTGAVVAVEAKSRHRPGVIHQRGDVDEQKVLRGDVRRLLREALDQDPGDKAFMVFIDLNSPLTPDLDVLDKKWAEDLRNLLDEFDQPTAEKPDPMTFFCVTNFSHHYHEDVVGTPGEYVFIQSRFVRDEVDSQLLDRLYRAVANYGRVPNLDVERVE